MESFLICFYILDYCYFINYENDLGGILGAMSPDLMVDGMPIDYAFLINWKKFYNPNIKNNYDIIIQIDAFLEYYEKEYGFCFKETRKLLKSDLLLNFVDVAKNKAHETCKKHNYK